MKFGIMQPYFFPYLGYFDLINRTDRWIVFDTAQYIRHGWVNRNRILHPTTGWQYILAPVKKHARETPINQIETLQPADWKSKLIGQLGHYRKRAPNFAETMDLVSSCFDDPDPNLSRLNTGILRRTCEYIGIPFRSETFSEMHLDTGPIDGPGDWALRICEALGATEYVNPPGGEELFDRDKFARSGITLTIQPPCDLAYSCRGYQFEPNLSIIDVLMWNAPATIKAHLDTIKTAASRPPGSA